MPACRQAGIMRLKYLGIMKYDIFSRPENPSFKMILRKSNDHCFNDHIPFRDAEHLTQRFAVIDSRSDKPDNGSAKAQCVRCQECKGNTNVGISGMLFSTGRSMEQDHRWGIPGNIILAGRDIVHPFADMRNDEVHQRREILLGND